MNDIWRSFDVSRATCKIMIWNKFAWFQLLFNFNLFWNPIKYIYFSYKLIITFLFYSKLASKICSTKLGKNSKLVMIPCEKRYNITIMQWIYWLAWKTLSFFSLTEIISVYFSVCDRKIRRFLCWSIVQHYTKCGISYFLFNAIKLVSGKTKT